jgi:hypothetical protein
MAKGIRHLLRPPLPAPDKWPRWFQDEQHKLKRLSDNDRFRELINPPGLNDVDDDPVEPAASPAGKAAPPKSEATATSAKKKWWASFRKMKLGDDYERLLSTSLRSAREMDALIHLKEGGTTGIFTHLIECAVAGQRVSAVAVLAKIKLKGIDAFRKELTAPPKVWAKNTINQMVEAGDLPVETSIRKLAKILETRRSAEGMTPVTFGTFRNLISEAKLWPR